MLGFWNRQSFCIHLTITAKEDDRVVNFLENDVVTDSESIRREVAMRGKMNGYNEQFLCGFRDVGD